MLATETGENGKRKQASKCFRSKRSLKKPFAGKTLGKLGSRYIAFLSTEVIFSPCLFLTLQELDWGAVQFNGT